MFAWPIVELLPLGLGLTISPHSLGSAVGFVLGALLLRHRLLVGGLVARDELSVVLQEGLSRLVLGAIVGARSFHVLGNLDRYADDPLAVFDVSQGGLSLLGGMLTALLVTAPYMRRQGIATLPLMDAGAAATAVGILCARIGDLVVGDHLGGPTRAWFGWRCTGRLADPVTGELTRLPVQPYPVGLTPSNGCFDTPVVQTALAGAATALVVLLVVLVVERRRPPTGVVVACWMLTYAPLRVALDVVRPDRRLFGLTGNQWGLLLAWTAALVLLLRIRATAGAPDPPGGLHDGIDTGADA